MSEAQKENEKLKLKNERLFDKITLLSFCHQSVFESFDQFFSFSRRVVLTDK